MVLSLAVALTLANRVPDPCLLLHSGQKVPDRVKDVIVEEKAKRIVETMYGTYASCKSYSDTGTSDMGNAHLTFATRYLRPERLFFGFTAKGFARDGRFVLWTTGERKRIFQPGVDGPGCWEDTVLTNTWYGDDKSMEANESLGLSIAGFTGISMGVAMDVTNIIFPSEVGGLSLRDMKDLVFEKSAQDRGVLCDVLYSREYLTRAWIDSSRHLMRRLSEQIEPSDPKQVTLFNPVLNQPVSDADLTFRPPQS